MARPKAKLTTSIFPTYCNHCKEYKSLQKMYVTTNDMLQLHFCTDCAHSAGEALALQDKIILSSRPAPPFSVQNR